jgi:hypothetical protein
MENNENIIRSLGFFLDYLEIIAPLLVITAATFTFAKLEVRK